LEADAMKIFMLTLAAGLLIASGSNRAEPEPGLQVEVLASPLPSRYPRPRVRFTNNTTATIQVLKPIDGSEWCWVMPYYQFTVTNAAGKGMKLVPRCGMHGHPYSDTKWPDDYLIVLKPAESHTLPVDLPFVLPKAGTYEIQFAYAFRLGEKSVRGVAYPPGLWTGEVQSKSVKVWLPKWPR
jgi:hypothetical protein